MTDDALGDSDATELVARLRRREVSAGELRAAAAARVATVAGPLNAVTAMIAEPVATEVQVAADAPLARIPSALKDNVQLTGFPTTQGSRAVPDTPAPASAPFTAQFLRLGLDPVALTTLPEFGLTATTESHRFGATRNPWDTDRSTGGSSGGSAALVAAGAVPMAHANDGGGSIRIPAACCGLVGLKPSRGRIVDLPELDRLPVNMVTQGVVTRTVRDTALYFAAAEREYRNPALPMIGHVTEPSRERLRIGMFVSGQDGIGVSADISEAVMAAGRLCERLGHHVELIDYPYGDHFGRDFLRYWSLLGLSVRTLGGQLYGRGFDANLVEDFTRGLAGLASGGLERMPASMARLRRMAGTQPEVFQRFDLTLAPVLGHAAPQLGWLGPDVEFRTHLVRLLRFAGFTAQHNIAGTPAISLPLGRTRDGRPIGVQFGAGVGQERRLLEVALQLEEAAPWPRVPSLDG